MTPFGQEQLASSRLQSHKSSFQAWKCVSFGCSLLAIVLLLSKWHEVTTDLQMLLGIEQLLAAQAGAASGAAGAGSDKSQDAAQGGQALSWPPVPLEQLLPAANETKFGMESMATNETMLMSHLHMSLSRELSGNQLLRQEVAAFVGEFRNAKSTLSLGSLLVAVYIVSWLLMTLAINDARISNDISLRNILLLSVFGAIDVAASAGFVMVRLIMYSVKNNSFAGELLSSAGLRDAPVRLSADQLTAFTALRLIAMRSCSAYADVFVSIIVGLLTILRVHAILRALAYYRRLRRSADLECHQQHPHRQAPLMMADDSSQPLERKQIWSASPFYATTSTANLISPGSASLGARLATPTRQAAELAPANCTQPARSFRHLTPVMDPGGCGERPQQQAVYAVVNRGQQQNTLPLPRSSRGNVGGLAAGSASLTRASQQFLFDADQQQLQLMRPAAANSTSKLNNIDSSPGAQSSQLLVLLKAGRGGGRQPSGTGHSQQPQRKQQQRTTDNNNPAPDRRNASSLLLVPREPPPGAAANPARFVEGPAKRGVRQQLAGATRHSSSSLQHSRRPPLRRHQLLQQLKRQPGKALLAGASGAGGRLLDCEAECESEPHTFRVRLAPAEQTTTKGAAAQQPRDHDSNHEDGQTQEFVGTREADLSQPSLAAGAQPVARQSSSASSSSLGKRLICDSSGNTYTLLSANQLDKLSRKLASTGQERQQLAQFVRTGSGGELLVAENPTYATASAGLTRRLAKQHSVDAGRQSSDVNNSVDSSSDDACSLIGADYDDDDDDDEPLEEESDCSSAVAILRRHQLRRRHQAPTPAVRTLGRRGAKARLMMGVRQTEELVAGSMGGRQQLDSNGAANSSEAPLFGVACSRGKAKQSDENLLLARYYYA